MIRVIIGSAAAAVAMFVIGFIFFGPLGLSNLATHRLEDPQAQQVQTVLRATIAETGTYAVPAAGKSSLQTQMYGAGPVAMIHYTAEGQIAGMDAATAVKGLIFNFIIALLIGVGLLTVDGRVRDFASRARLAAIMGVAGAAFVDLSVPVFEHLGWGHFIYYFVADALTLAAAGVIVAWFLKVQPEAAAVGEAPAPAAEADEL